MKWMKPTPMNNVLSGTKPTHVPTPKPARATKKLKVINVGKKAAKCLGTSAND